MRRPESASLVRAWYTDMVQKHQPPSTIVNADQQHRVVFQGVFGEENGAGEETRTPDPRITNALLYQLSYAGTWTADGRPRAVLRDGGESNAAGWEKQASRVG